MKRPTKFVKPLTTEQREQLSALMKSAAPQRTRMRAHAGLLRERRDSLEQMADIYQVERERVSQWLEWGEAEPFRGRDLRGLRQIRGRMGMARPSRNGILGYCHTFQEAGGNPCLANAQ